jgi:hypothetical protein
MDNRMSSFGLEEASPLISDFVKFARSRPSKDDLTRAVSKVLNVPWHAAVTAELENALLEVRDLYPGLCLLDLNLALLPARIDDHYRASELLEQFVNKYPTASLGYIEGIRIARAANLYKRVEQIAWRALEYLDKLVPFGPAEFSDLLVQAGQIGRHPLFFELCSRFREWLSAMPGYRTHRFACVADNLQTADYERIVFVSLGTNCMPWAVGNRWGFRPFLGEDKQHLPLNFAIQTTQSCSLMLEDRFEKLSDSSQYVLTRGPHGFDIASHKGYRFMFNHEVGQYWLTQGCENLVRRYKQRVSNFFKYAVAGPRVYILYMPWNVDVRAIMKNIEDMSADEHYRMLVIDSRVVAEGTQPRQPNTIWHKLSLPHEKYIWWQHFDTEEGVRFEATIHDAMRDAAHELVA